MTAIRTRFIVRALITAAIALTMVGVPTVAHASSPPAPARTAATVPTFALPTFTLPTACRPLAPSPAISDYVASCAGVGGNGVRFVLVTNLSTSTVLNLESSRIYWWPNYFGTGTERDQAGETWGRISRGQYPLPQLHGGTTMLLPPLSSTEVAASGAFVRIAVDQSAAYVGAHAVVRMQRSLVEAVTDPPTLKRSGKACANSVASSLSNDPSTVATDWQSRTISVMSTANTCRSFVKDLNEASEGRGYLTADKYATSVGDSVLGTVKGSVLDDLFEIGENSAKFAYRVARK